MNPLVQDIIVALVPIAVLQTGALIYFCGVVVTTLRNCKEDIARIQAVCDARNHCGRYAGEGIS